jgi:hypothetical protein
LLLAPSPALCVWRGAIPRGLFQEFANEFLAVFCFNDWICVYDFQELLLKFRRHVADKLGCKRSAGRIRAVSIAGAALGLYFFF